jgi:dihydroceramide fatty acyl 2-hydroxylase
MPPPEREQLPMQTHDAIEGSGARLLKMVAESRINYWLAYAVDLACPVVLAYLGWQPSSGWAVASLAFFGGAFVFSFIEYAMHRWFFHAPRSIARALHQTHHSSPRAAVAIPFPSSAGAAFLMWSYLAPLAGEQCAGFFGSGLLAAYFCYSLLHHFQHSMRIRALPLRLLRGRWVAHAVHHGRSDRNFGVTTSLWDHVFGTYHLPRKP